MTQPTQMNFNKPALGRFGAGSLYAAFREISVEAPAARWDALFALADEVCARAYGAGAGDAAAAQEDLHRTLYGLYSGRVAVPWNNGWRDLSDWRFDRLRQTLESAWNSDERSRHGDLLGKLPSVGDFPAWAEAKCQGHASNVSHPLFDFLAESATHAQLREFFFQETPFDIHFGDLLAMMLPGVYGGAKAEFSKNFWDEMGHGVPADMHRQLRQEMATRLGLAQDLYLRAELFCLEELRLANMYFHATSSRSMLPQAIGMMLATELMVPGRLDRQISGWRRVGWPEEAMQYLLVHVVVDVEHAHGWMNEVVLPLLQDTPHLMNDIVFGMARRLEHAGAVCDRMVSHLAETVPEAA